MSTKWVMRLFFSYGCKRPVSRTDPGIAGQSKTLPPHLRLRQIPGLIAAPDRAGKNCVPDNGDVRRVFRPGADDVSEAIFGMAGRIAVRDAQAAQVNEIVRAIALGHGRGFG